MPKKSGKRKRDKAPSHDELHKLRETEALFKSNLFRLQTAELLKEAAPAYASPALQGLEKWVRGLRQALIRVPEAELSWERGAAGSRSASCSHEHLAPLQLHGAKASLQWRPPAKVELVGSYLLRTVARPSLNIDLTVDDFLDMCERMKNDYGHITYQAVRGHAHLRPSRREISDN